MSDSFSYPDDQYILVGKVIKAHGLKGDLKCIPLSNLDLTPFNESRFALIADDGRMTKPLRSEKFRTQGRWFILKLETIDTRDEAELTAGMGILIARTELVVEDDELLSPFQLIGLSVRDCTSDKIIGVIDTTFNNGAQDIIVVRNGDDVFLIPLVDAIIRSWDEQDVLIDPPPGLLEINIAK